MATQFHPPVLLHGSGPISGLQKSLQERRGRRSNDDVITVAQAMDVFLSGLAVLLETPRFMTNGQMLIETRAPDVLAATIHDTNSCARPNDRNASATRRSLRATQRDDLVRMGQPTAPTPAHIHFVPLHDQVRCRIAGRHVNSQDPQV